MNRPYISLAYIITTIALIPEIPKDVRLFIAKQLNLPEDLSIQYLWDSRTRGDHIAWIRQQTGFRFPQAQDKEDVENWLRQEGTLQAVTSADLFECAVQRFRSLQIELPSEKELQRIVNAALNGLFSDVHHKITRQLDDKVRKAIDGILTVPEGESFSTFEKLKGSARTSSVKNLQREIIRLQQLRSMGISKEYLKDVPFEVQKLLKRRANNETASGFLVANGQKRTILFSQVY